MTVYHQKSAEITNLDATPAVRGTAGRTGEGRIKVKDTYITPTASAGIDSTIQLFRIPWRAIVKKIEAQTQAQDTTGMFDCGVYYATDGSNGPALGASSLLAASAVDQDLFWAGAKFDGGGTRCRVISRPGFGETIITATPSLWENTAWAESEADNPLWEVAGLSADPGGNADIALTVTEAPGASTTPIYARIEYVE